MEKAILTPIDNPEKVVKASNCLMSDGVTSVESAINDSVVSQKSGNTLTITGFGVMVFYNATTNCIINLPFVPKHQISYSAIISIHGGSDYTRTGTITTNTTGLRITDIPEGRNGSFAYSITFTF